MNLLRKLPKIDKLVAKEEFAQLNTNLVTKLAREQLENLRRDILDEKTDTVDEEKLCLDIQQSYAKLFAPSLRPLINATGVILHTNMGRSLIHKDILQEASKVICNYSNLEYNQDKGCRGERYEHVSGHLKSLLDVEDVLVVNNNASAVFLILNTFAKEKEVVVSRGELVEIGGSFRIPEVMAQSGAKLCEVGATNKTKKSDYENAITEETAMLMKVHQSNFSIEGFSEDVSYEEVRALSEKHNLIDYCDWGSGYIPSLPFGLGNKEPSLPQILRYKPSLISFSGDKLFGSVQAGIIAGKKELIDKLKKNQLLRMLRVDKVTLAILEETIKAYLQENFEKIPTLEMLFADMDTLYKKAETIAQELPDGLCDTIQTSTFMGGGTLPNREFPSVALHVKGKAIKLERVFRQRDIIGRIEKDQFLLDVRTILTQDIPYIIKTIQEVVK